MNKKLNASAALLAALLLLTSCGEAAVSNTVISSSISEVITETSLSETTSSESEHKAYDHTFNPHCLSQIYIDKYGKEFEENYYMYCDAILSGAETVKCSKKEWLPKFHELSRTYLPIAEEYTYVFEDEITAAGDGEYKLTYTISKDEFLKKADEFKDRIESLIERACMEGDTPFEMTIALYKSESERLTYDYAAINEDPDGLVTQDLSPYRALMTDTGICQEIAGAYAYLLMQVGVDAITCGGLTKDSTTAHEWTLVKIDGKYYHCDVTFQLSEPATLAYFGMNDDQREIEGDWDMPYNNIGNTNDIWHKDLPIEDSRFKILWSVSSYLIDRESHTLRCYDSDDCTGNPIAEIPLA